MQVSREILSLASPFFKDMLQDTSETKDTSEIKVADSNNHACGTAQSHTIVIIAYQPLLAADLCAPLQVLDTTKQQWYKILAQLYPGKQDIALEGPAHSGVAGMLMQHAC
jgi:hypothetical protein